MPKHPTLLRRPDADPILSRVEDFMPGAPGDYYVKQLDDVWRVIAVATREVMYRGPGPVDVAKSPALF